MRGDPGAEAPLALRLAEPLEVDADAIDAGGVGPRGQRRVVRPERQDEGVRRRSDTGFRRVGREAPLVRILVVIRTVEQVDETGDVRREVLHAVPDARRDGQQRRPGRAQVEDVDLIARGRALARVVQHHPQVAADHEHVVPALLVLVPRADRLPAQRDVDRLLHGAIDEIPVGPVQLRGDAVAGDDVADLAHLDAVDQAAPHDPVAVDVRVVLARGGRRVGRTCDQSATAVSCTSKTIHALPGNAGSGLPAAP